MFTNFKKTSLMAFLCLLFINVSIAQNQSKCSDFLSWNSSKVYWANDRTIHNGDIYKAKWWTQNQVPNDDVNGPWLKIGPCETSNTVNPLTHCNDNEDWESTETYVQGDIVVYQDQKFEAKWWTQNQVPSSTDAWQLISACVYGTIDISTTSLAAFSTTVGTPSSVLLFNVSGSNLSSDILIKAPSHFEISLDGVIFSNEISLSPVSNIVSLTAISVRYNPFVVGNHLGIITIESIGLDTEEVAVSGNSQGAWVVNSSNTLYSNLSFTNIGIGTSSVPSTYKLGVDGKIIAKGLKIKFNNWADYVFEDDYVLPNLDELETYVAKENHLPGIPAEAEVLKDGMAIEDMNVILLQKIEELTLLMIEQNKKMKALENEMNELKAK